jgi:hypothetical protein
MLGRPARPSKFARHFLHFEETHVVQKPKSRLTTTKLKVQSVRLFSNPAPLDLSRLDNRRDILFANAGRPTRGWQAIPCGGRRPEHVTPQLPGSRDHETTGKRDPPGPARWTAGSVRDRQPSSNMWVCGRRLHWSGHGALMSPNPPGQKRSQCPSQPETPSSRDTIPARLRQDMVHG